MNNSLIEAQLNTLSAQFQSDLNKAKRSLLISSVIYLLLVAYVIFMTIYLCTEIKKATAPEEIVSVVKGQVYQQIPQLRANINAQAPEYYEIISNHAIEQINATIPVLEGAAKTKIDEYSQKLIKEIFAQYGPVLEENMREIIKLAREEKNFLKDEAAQEALVNSIIATIDQNISGIVENECRSNIDKIVAFLEKLESTPEAQLSKEDLAKKKLLIYWIFWVENADHEKNTDGIMNYILNFKNSISDGLKTSISIPEK